MTPSSSSISVLNNSGTFEERRERELSIPSVKKEASFRKRITHPLTSRLPKKNDIRTTEF